MGVGTYQVVVDEALSYQLSAQKSEILADS
jgi:hypothetical protein